jgi:hypothetical protein
MAQVVEHTPSKDKVLSPNSSTAKKKKKKEKPYQSWVQWLMPVTLAS